MITKITADKITQFERATCTTGSEHIAEAYLESEEGCVNSAVASYQADQRAAKWDAIGGLAMPAGPAA